MKQISDNEIYLLIKYIKSVLWREAKRLSYIEGARSLKVKHMTDSEVGFMLIIILKLSRVVARNSFSQLSLVGWLIKR